MKILIILLLVVVVMLGAGFGYLFLNMNQQPAAVVVAEDGTVVEEPVVEEVETRDAIYASLNPAFLITFTGAQGLKYLQTELQVMSYDQEVIDEVEANRPALRNNVIMLLSKQEYSILQSSEGRESLRSMIKDEVQESLRTKLPVEEVYYNSFVIQ